MLKASDIDFMLSIRIIGSLNFGLAFGHILLICIIYLFIIFLFNQFVFMKIGCLTNLEIKITEKQK